MNKIHFIETRTKYFERPLYCRAVRDLSPTKDGISEVSCSKDVVLSPSKNDPDYDFINLDQDSVKKTPASKLFRNGNCSSTEDDSDNDKEIGLNNDKISKVNVNKRGRNSSGRNKNKDDKKFRK